MHPIHNSHLTIHDFMASVYAKGTNYYNLLDAYSGYFHPLTVGNILHSTTLTRKPFFFSVRIIKDVLQKCNSMVLDGIQGENIAN
jgi:hypothetical protein